MPPTAIPRNDFSYERYRARLSGAVLFSLLVHALILSMQLGIPGLGLPSLELPWRERRVQAVDLSVSLAGMLHTDAADHTAAALPESPVTASSAHPPASTDLKLYVPPVVNKPAAKGNEVPSTAVPASTNDQAASPRKRLPRRKKEQPVIALAETRKETFKVAPPAYGDAPTALMPEEAVIPPPADPEPVATEEPVVIAQDAEPQGNAEDAPMQRDTAARQRDEEAHEQAALARARLEAKDREEAERVLVEARQREAALREEQAQAEREARELALRRETEEAARVQAALALQREQEAAAQRALELEARRQEEVQREAMRRETERAERETAALQARKQTEEAERQAALERLRREEDRRAQQQAAAQRALANPPRNDQLASAQDRNATAPARPEAFLPALPDAGLASRALEQARRSEIFRSDVARATDHAEPDSRRRSIFGKVSQDVGLMMYVEAWRLKIERNGNLNYQQSSAEKARGDPVVTVAIRSDGSVENVIIERSSGRTELDEAVRRIVRLNARYSVFPPELARRFDVIEIRRIWNFDDRLRILEEVR